jgi:hypothetical protein
MLSVIMFNVIMVIFGTLSIILLSAFMQCVIVLNVVAPLA